MHKKRVVIGILVPSISGGGAEKASMDLVAHFSKKRFEVHLIIEKDFSHDVPDVPEHVKVTHLKSSNSVKSIASLFSTIRKEEIDVLYSSLPHLNFLNALMKILFRKKLKAIVSVHNNLPQEFHDLKSGPLWKKLTPFTYARADLIHCVSKGLAKQTIEAFGAKENKIRVIPNPIDILRISSLSHLETPTLTASPKKEFCFIAVGRLEPQKNYPLLIEGVRQLVSLGYGVKLNILGEGSERASLTRLIFKHNLENHVFLRGKVSNPYPWIRVSDCLVLTSKYEGFGLVLVEAMALETLVLSSNCEYGPEEITNNGEHGVLFSNGNQSSLVKEMLRTLDLNGVELSEFLAMAKQRAANYEIVEIVKTIEAMFLESV